MARFYKLLEHAYKKSETLKTILAFVLLPHIFTNGLNKIHFLNSFRNHFAQVSGKEAVNVLPQWAGGLGTAVPAWSHGSHWLRDSCSEHGASTRGHIPPLWDRGDCVTHICNVMNSFFFFFSEKQKLRLY